MLAAARMLLVTGGRMGGRTRVKNVPFCPRDHRKNRPHSEQYSYLYLHTYNIILSSRKFLAAEKTTSTYKKPNDNFRFDCSPDRRNRVHKNKPKVYWNEGRVVWGSRGIEIPPHHRYTSAQLLGCLGFWNKNRRKTIVSLKLIPSLVRSFTKLSRIWILMAWLEWEKLYRRTTTTTCT